jgi:hypothetical protein
MLERRYDICGWMDGWLPPTVKRGEEVWSSPPTGPAPCLVMSAQGAGGDSLTTCAPVCPWLPGWNQQQSQGSGDQVLQFSIISCKHEIVFKLPRIYKECWFMQADKSIIIIIIIMMLLIGNNQSRHL